MNDMCNVVVINGNKITVWMNDMCNVVVINGNKIAVWMNDMCNVVVINGNKITVFDTMLIKKKIDQRVLNNSSVRQLSGTSNSEVMPYYICSSQTILFSPRLLIQCCTSDMSQSILIPISEVT